MCAKQPSKELCTYSLLFVKHEFRKDPAIRRKIPANLEENGMSEGKSATGRKSGQMDLSDRLLYATLLALSFPLCLIAAVVARLVSGIGHHTGRSSQSIFAEAKSAAYAAVGYAFHA